MRSTHSASPERGSALVEFALAVTFFWVPLFLGMTVIGFELIAAMQVTQVCRDAAHMYSYGIDFSQSSYQNLLAQMASGLNLNISGDSGPYGNTTNLGSAVIVLSTISYVDATACQAGGYQANTTSCPNLGSTIFRRQIVIGSANLHASAFGTPKSADMDSTGTVSTAGFLTDTADQATNFSPNVLSVTSSTQFIYVAEMWVTQNNGITWNVLGPPEISSRAIF